MFLPCGYIWGTETVKQASDVGSGIGGGGRAPGVRAGAGVAF